MAGESPALVIVDPSGSNIAEVSAAGKLQVNTAFSSSLPSGSNPLGQVGIKSGETGGLNLETTQQSISSSLSSLITAVAKEVTLAAVSSSLNLIRSEMAKEITLAAVSSSLAAIRLTDGVKKIVDPLPSGSNLMGRVNLADFSGSLITATGSAGGVRLQVETQFAPNQSLSVNSSFTPSNPANFINTKLLHSGSSNFLVNGATGFKDFLFTASVDKDIILSELRIVLTADNINFVGNRFGPISGLTNGVSIRLATLGNPEVEISNLKINEDFLSLVTPTGIFYDASGPQDSLATGLGFGGKVTLKSGSADFLKVRVQDDLTNVKFSYFQANILAVRD